MTQKECIIFDIDGTLANVEHRRHYLPNWNAFFEAMKDDTPNEDIFSLLWSIPKEDFDIFICSGRPEEYRAITEQWLEDNSVGEYKELMMRPSKEFDKDSNGNRHSDVVIKRRMLKDIQSRGYNVRYVVDDRQQVVDMWREEGITCLQCAPGDFDNHISFHRYREPTLTILVGPSGSGKSTWCENRNGVISSDKLREEFTGDFKNQSANNNVFKAFHELAEARLSNGLDVILDATHLKNKDRKKSVEIGIKHNAVIEYMVFNRPMVDKIKTGGWRNDVIMKNKGHKGKDISLIEYHENVFKNNFKDIYLGDHYDEVRVIVPAMCVDSINEYRKTLLKGID